MYILLGVIPMDAVDRLFALVDEKYWEQKDFAAEIGVIPQRVSAWRKRTSKSYTKYLPAPEGAGLTQEFALIFDQLSPQAQNEIIAEMLKRKRQEQ